VVSPLTGNEKVVRCSAFDMESETIQQTRASLVFWQVVGHDAVEVQVLEDMGNGKAERGRHEALTLVGFIDSISQIAGLEGSPNHLGEIDST
jgi:hypothetical protein